MNPLQQLIADSLESSGLSQRQAVARSGGLLTTATMSRVASGVTVNITNDTINGLALALDVRESLVRQAAENAARPAQLVEVSAACARLSQADQDEVIAFMETKLAEHEAAARALIKKNRPLRRRAR